MSQAFAILAIYPNYMSQLCPIYVPSVPSVLSVSHQCPINILTMSYDNTGQRYIFIMIKIKQFSLIKLPLISLEIKSVDSIKMIIDLSNNYQNLVKKLWYRKEFHKGKKHPYFILQ